MTKQRHFRERAVADVDGDLMVMELEVIEPELFFDREPAAAGRLADECRADPGALPFRLDAHRGELPARV